MLEEGDSNGLSGAASLDWNNLINVEKKCCNWIWTLAKPFDIWVEFIFLAARGHDRDYGAVENYN